MERFRLRSQNAPRFQPAWQTEIDLPSSNCLTYRYAVPLMIISGLPHWLVSQSIFVADINVNDRSSHPTLSVSTCGYSVIGMVFTLIAGELLLAVPIGLGFRRYRPWMPLAGTCSVAVAATCNAQETERDDMASLPLQWGAVPDASIPKTGVGHCCFSSEEVEMPKEGSAYAGMGG